MPHRYTCYECQISGAVHSTKYGARRDATGHRTAAHEGMAPAAGDHIGYAPPSGRGPAIVIGIFAVLIVIKELTGIAPDDIARWLGLL